MLPLGSSTLNTFLINMQLLQAVSYTYLPPTVDGRVSSEHCTHVRMPTSVSVSLSTYMNLSPANSLSAAIGNIQIINRVL